MRTAWLIDKHKDYKMVRKDIAAIKVAMPKVYHDIAATALHLHGALGVSNEMPFMGMVTSALVMGIADGPTEVHKVTVAKQVLRDYRPDNDLFPAYHLPKLREAARDQYAAELDRDQGGLSGRQDGDGGWRDIERRPLIVGLGGTVRPGSTSEMALIRALESRRGGRARAPSSSAAPSWPACRSSIRAA